MINLNEYDDVSPKVNKKTSWLSIKTKQLFSREIAYRPYVTIGSKYNPKLQFYSYFLIFLDEPPDDRTYSKVYRDDYGRIKVSLKSIWNETSLRDYDRDVNINIKLTDHADNGDIYQIDV